ncbi:MAG: VCBS repeat-containing protein [Verrucomicrobiales bacterium]
MSTGCSEKNDKGKGTPAVNKISTTPAQTLSILPGLPDRSADAPLAALFAKINPDADEKWSSEAFTKAAGKQLHKIADALAARGSFDAVEGGLASCVSSSYHGPDLRPDTMEVFKDGALSISRGAAQNQATATHQGRAGFQQSLIQYAKDIGAKTDAQIKTTFKIIRVEVSAAKATTLALLETICSKDEQQLQQTSTWKCSWVREGKNTSPLLSSITVSDFEEVIYQSGLPAFINATHSLMGNEKSFREQMLHGADYWYGNLDVAFDIHQGNHGMSIGDANGDSLDDLFICQPAGLPNLLYIRNQDGTLRDATHEAGLDWLDGSRSALFADFDNDGDQDMVIGLEYSLGLFENNGLGKFKLISTVEIHSWPQSIATADFDNDGDLDIFVCGYSPRGETDPGDIFANPVPYHDANNGARNFMLENKSQWIFADITEAVGMNTNNRRFSFAATWEDYDNDGDQDLYVANDFGRNNLYRNDLIAGDIRKFTDVAAQAGVEDISAGMSVSWGDYNRDGLIDLYVSNMFSAAGNRIAFQRQFKPGTDGISRQSLQRHARGNTLFENTGDGTFKDVSRDAGVTMGRWAWGSGFADINNDGWQDLYVANGFFTAQDTEDL